MVFLSIYYLWQWAEKGRVRNLSEGFRGKALPQPKAHQETARIAQNIEADFHSTNKNYLYVYIFAESVSFAACLASFAYYAWLLQLFNQEESIWKAYTDFISHYNLRNTDSHLMQLFPRKVTCPMPSLNINCTINYQTINEMLHILTLLINTIVIIFYAINYIYFFWLFKHIHYFAKDITRAEIAQLRKLPLGKKLIILLLHSNMDSITHMILVQKMANINNLTYITTSNLQTNRHNRPIQRNTTAKHKYNINYTNTETTSNNMSKSPTFSAHLQREGPNTTTTSNNRSKSPTFSAYLQMEGHNTTTNSNNRSKSPTFSEYLQMEGPAIDRLLETPDTPYSTDNEEA
jgi:hypothetical protein